MSKIILGLLIALSACGTSAAVPADASVDASTDAWPCSDCESPPPSMPSCASLGCTSGGVSGSATIFQPCTENVCYCRIHNVPPVGTACWTQFSTEQG